MEYFIRLIKNSIKSAMVETLLILALWGTLYNLTGLATVTKYFWIGVAVCVLNTVIRNFKLKSKSVIHVSALWVVMAGLVLVLHHAGFEAAAVFTASVFLASPFFGATVCEGIVGFTLLVILAVYFTPQV